MPKTSDHASRRQYGTTNEMTRPQVCTTFRIPAVLKYAPRTQLMLAKSVAKFPILRITEQIVFTVQSSQIEEGRLTAVSGCFRLWLSSS